MIKIILRTFFKISDSGVLRYFTALPALFTLWFLTPIGDIVKEILTGNIMFFETWYENNTWGSTYIHLFLTNEDAFNVLLPYVLLIIGLLSLLVLIFHMSLYRLIFKDYISFSDNYPVRDGRIYWSNHGKLANFGRKLRKYCKAPVNELENKILHVNRNWILNIFMPYNSMTLIILPLDTRIDKMLQKHVVHEKRNRLWTTINGLPALIFDDSELAKAEVKLDGLKKQNQEAMRDMIQTGQQAVHGNPLVNKHILNETGTQLPFLDTEEGE